MAGNVTFAKLALMVATDQNSGSYSTDPYPLGENDRASAIPTIHYGFGPNTPTLTYTCKVSNDGINWVSQGPTEGIDSMTAGAKTQKVARVNGQFIRFDFSFDAGGGSSGTAAVCFDLLVYLDVGEEPTA